MADERGKAPMRIWVAAKETVQPRQYESAICEIGIEVDHGTPKADILRAIADADVIYTLLREKVHVRAAEARATAVEPESGVVRRGGVIVGGRSIETWRHQPGERPERTGRK